MSNFAARLDELMERATKGPCAPYVVSPKSASDDFYESYSPWISGKFPRAVQVGRGLCIAADDMALIAYLVNHAPAIRDLVRDMESIAKNTCCDKCQEAALVARAALTGGKE